MAQVGVDQKWTASVQRVGVGQSAGVLIPGWIRELTCAIIPAGNTAGVQYTLDDDSVADGSATWIDWDPGVVTVNTGRAAIGPITRVRINQTVGAGTSTLYLAGQRGQR